MISISYQTYLNKVHGGWIGKCIGGTIGALMENNKELMDFTLDNVFPEEIPPNDDLDLQLLWLQVLEKKGSRITSKDLAEAWMRYCWYPFNEYGYFVKNYRLGILPPLSGTFNNHFFKNSMGCPIRSEIWGFICPATPELASEYAYKDGALDHDLLSIYAEQFLAVIESQAFILGDMEQLIEFGLKQIPKDNELYRCIQFVIQEFQEGLGWKKTRRRMLNHFSSPDASYSVQNIGLTVLALLYGKGDFTETMLIAVNSGYDTDCTAATAGAILGQLLGADRIPAIWLDKMGTEYVIGIDVTRRSLLIEDLAIDTCAAGLSLMRDGLLNIEITEIPDHVKASLPEPEAISPYEIEIKYEGLPSIGYAENTLVTVSLHNRTKQEQSGILQVQSAKHLKASLTKVEIIVPANSSIHFPISFEISKDATFIPQKNMIDLYWMTQGGEEVVAETCFGLTGASRVKVIGPFWDTFDTHEHSDNPYLNRMPEGRYHFNNFINVDKAYMDETFHSWESEEGIHVNFHEDKLPLNELFGHQGQSCVYLFHNLLVPTEREASLLIGNNDAFKCWLNGELVCEAKEHTMWMPYNHRTSVKLRAGTNLLILKIIRTDSQFEFSYGFQGDSAGYQGSFSHFQETTKNHWFVDLASLV
ncbi:ADP-ribosylglycohydrolase family protein [Paenibacillus roseipurpureus]|uniref:ADP-ribosylglycohydrolase family protein n=1 Tax=Paenibacillus roseopurpureus TaxID=2918901 RepID=A0AA96RM05_9BACL|nr:ADP-ribosylglycohydrolase family protein [Paenibacillus sp. MBLB1832]WNR45966.1 ADP-ribosylglycohydrolase family protein [Paenibacillus sp. MBLB1832]